MKKLRTWVAKAIIYIYACLTIILGELLTLTICVLIGDNDKACEMIVDILDNAKHTLLG